MLYTTRRTAGGTSTTSPQPSTCIETPTSISWCSAYVATSTSLRHTRPHQIKPDDPGKWWRKVSISPGQQGISLFTRRIRFGFLDLQLEAHSNVHCRAAVNWRYDVHPVVPLNMCIPTGYSRRGAVARAASLHTSTRPHCDTLPIQSFGPTSSATSGGQSCPGAVPQHTRSTQHVTQHQRLGRRCCTAGGGLANRLLPRRRATAGADMAGRRSSGRGPGRPATCSGIPRHCQGGCTACSEAGGRGCATLRLVGGVYCCGRRPDAMVFISIHPSSALFVP